MIYEQFLAGFTDWRPTTLYWQRFSIAERFGEDEILEVYEQIFKESKDDYKLLTELTMILNHKSWQHCENIDRSGFCELYKNLFSKTYNYAISTLHEKELTYFLDTTD